MTKSRSFSILLLLLIIFFFNLTSLYSQKNNRFTIAKLLENNGICLSGLYNYDIFYNAKGGIQKKKAELGFADVMFDIDNSKLLGIEGNSLYFDFILTHGNDPSANSGDFQGVSNIASEKLFRINEAWLQQSFLSEKLSVLFGIYDINSEFDVIETSGIFLNGSFGMGTAITQSGKNSLSSFPNNGLGIRLQYCISDEMALSAAISDGVPGSLSNTQKLDYSLHSSDGFYLISELSYSQGKDKLSVYPKCSKRGKRRGHRFFHNSRANRRRHRGCPDRISPYEIHSPDYLKIAIGSWMVSSKSNNYAPAIISERNWGLYGLAEGILLSSNNNKSNYLSGFIRIGLANKNVNPIDQFYNCGIMLNSDILQKHPLQIGLGLSAAKHSSLFRKFILSNENLYTKPWEYVLELSIRARLLRHLYIQPDLQYIRNPRESENKSALQLGIRMEVEI